MDVGTISAIWRDGKLPAKRCRCPPRAAPPGSTGGWLRSWPGSMAITRTPPHL